MTTLMQFSGHPLLHALGWTLIHFCWQGALVAVLLWCALGLMAGRSSQARYGAACFAMALLVAMPVATFAHLAAADLRASRAVWDADLDADAGMVLQVGAGDIAVPWQVRMAVAVDHGMPWLLAAWFAGAIFFVVRLNFGLIVARRLRSAGTEAPADELLQLFDALRRRLGIERAVRLLHSARVQVPTVIGWLRPVVLIPASCLSGLSMEQIEAIFCHELAHVRRHDYLVSVFQSVAETLLFYHPAVWWVSKQVRRERECCCDEVAVANGGDVLAYAKALSYMEERRAAFPEFVLGANGGVLTMRIKRLLGCREDAESSQLAAFVLLALMVAAAGSYAVTVARAEIHSARVAARVHDEPVVSTPGTQLLALNSAPRFFQLAGAAQQTGSAGDQGQPGNGEASEATMQAVYKMWLEQDVLYLITPEERDAFLKLTNNDEREKFVEQFWARRDPPGAPVGSYKEEIYARFAYSNEHFAADIPGWKTDRGRTYIVNGKPYEIDSHPSGGEDRGIATNNPFEVWHYKAAKDGEPDVYLKFVDDSHTGRYRLVGQVLPPIAVSGNAPPLVRVVPAAPNGPIRVASGVMAGNALHLASPVYPKDAKAAHVQGVVVLHAIISKTGEIENLQVISGSPLLTKSAIDAVQRWKYKPYLLNGEPTAVETTINVNYTFAETAAPPPPASDGEQPAQPKGPIRVSAGAMAGALIYKAQPVYPADAKAAGVQGTVVLHALISKTGTVENLTVVSGPKELTDSALDAVNQWKYSPYLLNGEPTAVETTIAVNYILGEAPPPQSEDSAQENHGVAPEYDGAPLKRIGGGVSSPVVIYQVEPEFSEQARQAKFMGVVLLNLIVDQNGVPQNVHVLRGVGMGLDEKAIEAVRQYRFKPAVEDGKPVAVSLNVEVNFQIFEKPPAAAAPASSLPASSTPKTEVSSAVTVNANPAVKQIGNGVSAPVVTFSALPEYTPEARKAKTEGIVLVNMIVDQRGRPQNVHVVHGIGSGLDMKAVEAVKQYKFKPAMEDGKPVAVAINVEVNFKIF